MTQSTMAGEADTQGMTARHVRGPEAVATWSLRRYRKPANATEEQVQLLNRVVRDARIDVARQYFLYRGRDIAVRPSVARLLARLLQDGGRRVHVAEFCDAVYGRPASLRAVRQTAFRASRVMERLDCPLLVCCHSAHVFLQRRVRRFERRLSCKVRT